MFAWTRMYSQPASQPDVLTGEDMGKIGEGHRKRCERCEELYISEAK